MSTEKSMLTHNGETLSITEWAKRTGLKDKTIFMRIRSGWTVERALERPLQHGFLAHERVRKDRKSETERAEERRQIREWLRTQPAEIEERREEGNIL